MSDNKQPIVIGDGTCVNDRRHGLAPKDFDIVNTDELATLRDKAAAFDWLSRQGCCELGGDGGELRYLCIIGGKFYESKQLIDCINQAMKANK